MHYSSCVLFPVIWFLWNSITYTTINGSKHPGYALGPSRDDVMSWIWFSNYWRLMRRNHRSRGCLYLQLEYSVERVDIDLLCINTLRPRQNGRHFADDTFKPIFLNENIRISINISLKFVPKGPINNIPPLVQIMAWRRPGDKPLSETMLANLLTHICVSRPQWVKCMFPKIGLPIAP